jgi:hypothetical protein
MGWVVVMVCLLRWAGKRGADDTTVWDEDPVLALSVRALAVIEFRVLGSLEVVDGDRLLPLGSPQQRALLAVLLVHRGEPMSSDRLIDELRRERAPASAIKIVQGYVSNLQKVLGDGLLVTRGGGYSLQLDAGQLDVDCFEALIAEGRRALRRGDARTAVVRLREALASWRGPPLADFAYESFAQAEAAGCRSYGWRRSRSALSRGLSSAITRSSWRARGARPRASPAGGPHCAECSRLPAGLTRGLAAR